MDPDGIAISVYVRYLSTDVFEGRAACSRPQRPAHQGQDVVLIQPTGKEVPRARVGPLVPVPRQEVLRILREGSHASSWNVQQQVVCLVGIGRSHVAFVATIEHSNADGGIGRCEPEQIQGEQPPRQSCPDDGDPAHCFFVLAALGRPLGRVLKAQVVPRRLRRIGSLSSWLRKHTLTTRHYRRFLHFLGLKNRPRVNTDFIPKHAFTRYCWLTTDSLAKRDHGPPTGGAASLHATRWAVCDALVASEGRLGP